MCVCVCVWVCACVCVCVCVHACVRVTPWIEREGLETGAVGVNDRQDGIPKSVRENENFSQAQ